MNLALRIIIDLFIAGGCFFAFAGAVGLVRMPDTFTRMQSSTNITTLGVLLTLIGALLYCIFVWHSWGSAAKVIVIGVLTILANPVGGHAIARAAYRIGIRPGKELVIRRPGPTRRPVLRNLLRRLPSAQDAQELPAADRKEGEEQ